ncbi:Sec-independent protein translocase subunit TatB [Wolbachia pipientis]|uniref:Sec-independent protein translocase subunit TatB n=1 Tax=Wolbachia pipientis TaxID=955 RepID=UPI0025A3C898|nr:hypothetical protein [Wolbachia pipientis]MDM8335760.1 hypothetical protein [Wolbachia pipientis]
MFGIGLSEILVVALVSIMVLDKNDVPVFINLIKSVYRYFMIVRSETRNLLKDASVDGLYKECDTEKVNYIVGEDGKFYPSYNVDSASEGNDGKDSGSR